MFVFSETLNHRCFAYLHCSSRKNLTKTIVCFTIIIFSISRLDEYVVCWRLLCCCYLISNQLTKFLVVAIASKLVRYVNILLFYSIHVDDANMYTVKSWRSLTQWEKKVTADDVGDEYVERIHMACECHDVNAALA